MVARLALCTTHDLGLRCLILEGDSLEVISLLSDPHGEIPWLISSVMIVLTLLRLLQFLDAFHVKCCANSAVDHLTKHVRNNEEITNTAEIMMRLSSKEMKL